MYKREFRLGVFNVDVYLPGYNCSIQSDGAYWHGCCTKCSKGGKLTSKQIVQRYKDKACITYHKHTKVSILRFCECEILNDRELVRQTILDSINVINKGKLVYRGRE